MAQPIKIARLSGPGTQKQLLRRGEQPEPALSRSIQERNAEIFGRPITAHEVVDQIVRDVQSEGDTAVRRYTEIFDQRTLEELEVPRTERNRALAALGPELRDALKIAAGRIRSFHERQVRQSWFEAEELGVFGQIVRPLERVGIYTPGGSAALPSSLLMTAIPARVAGVEEIIVAAPPRGENGISNVILAAAAIAGVDRVFAIGGAQAIAALAFGTESVPQVDKIYGPGNIFVALAKQRVSGTVAIDQIAGPTETLLIADETADIEFVAADLIAQAEHDPLASAILITTSPGLADSIPAEISRQAAELEREKIIGASLENNGGIVLVDSLEEAIDCANGYAPEHLCLLVKDPWALVPRVRNAGGVFIGESSPEALGDYTAGPSHVMP
ncbi:MAG TPA: histidinol dehydrogenase, partial [Thermomicrobiales bacterium]|nr:histidinol dehydrogenase [Thermomicrobiales bacterium]